MRSPVRIRPGALREGWAPLEVTTLAGASSLGQDHGACTCQCLMGLDPIRGPSCPRSRSGDPGVQHIALASERLNRLPTIQPDGTQPDPLQRFPTHDHGDSLAAVASACSHIWWTKPPPLRPLMAICSYLVLPDRDQEALAERLRSIPGCDAFAAENRSVVLLVTETESKAAEDDLRRELETVPGIQSLVMTFGQIDSDLSRAISSPLPASP